VEARQYGRFARAGLPVADYVFSAERRLWGRRGIYLTGVVVTRTVDRSKDLRRLRRSNARPWVMEEETDNSPEVARDLGTLLTGVHRAHLVHGDFMLKNILFCGRSSPMPYCMIDLASGWAMRGGEDDPNGRVRDLVRMVCSMARNGLGLPAVRCFLESYGYAWDTIAPPTAGELLRRCLNASDRKAREAARLLGIDPCHPPPLEPPNSDEMERQYDRRQEDLGLRADLQRRG
jgi:hypothetical protein